MTATIASRAGAAAPAPATKRAKSRGAALRPLLWIGPAILLVAVVVIWPVVIMFQTSFLSVDPSGFVGGFAGWANFTTLLHEDAFAGVVARTGIWVVVVVTATIVLSLLIAQLFNQRFPGRRFVRLALIAPWGASVMMTAIIFRWALNPNNGAIVVILNRLGLIDFNTKGADPLGQPAVAFVWMMIVAIFVSIPFTAYSIMAGLQSISPDVYEAAQLDGASAVRTYFSVTLPLIRPSLIVALLINIINVINSFPIIWEMTRGGPGYDTSTTTTFMYQLKQSNIGESSAMSVINFGLIIVVVLVFLRVSGWKEQTES